MLPGFSHFIRAFGSPWLALGVNFGSPCISENYFNTLTTITPIIVSQSL